MNQPSAEKKVMLLLGIIYNILRTSNRSWAHPGWRRVKRMLSLIKFAIIFFNIVFFICFVFLIFLVSVFQQFIVMASFAFGRFYQKMCTLTRAYIYSWVDLHASIYGTSFEDLFETIIRGFIIYIRGSQPFFAATTNFFYKFRDP